MIDPDAQSRVRETHHLAPARLRREDVAELRKLLAAARRIFEGLEHGGAAGAKDHPLTLWGDSAVIYFDRGDKARTIGRLGRPMPAVLVKAQWEHVVAWGLTVKVETHTSLGGRRGDLSLVVGQHRFRSTTTEAQFCRECSHLVRLGLGWIKDRKQRLEQIL
jgi:hypothetical protein